MNSSSPEIRTTSHAQSGIMPDSVPVLFIGGIGRSGTTILELSLGTDTRVVSLGEVTHLWERSLIEDEACGCGLAFSQCPFWTAVGERAFGGWSAIDARRVVALKRIVDRSLRVPQYALRLGRRALWRQVREYASYYARIYAAAADVSGAEVVIDSSKQASLPHILRFDPRVDLKVLHCIRDSRAVAYSWTKRVRRPEAKSEDTGLMMQYAPRVLALKWVLHNLVIESLRLVRVRTMRMYYEEWIKHPARHHASALQFAGLDYQPNRMVNRNWIFLPREHTCSGNPMRFQTGRVQVLRDENWKRDLPAINRNLVTVITAPLLVFYRYWRTRS